MKQARAPIRLGSGEFIAETRSALKGGAVSTPQRAQHQNTQTLRHGSRVHVSNVLPKQLIDEHKIPIFPSFLHHAC